jgi:CBS-domain-containing membrane protein
MPLAEFGLPDPSNPHQLVSVLPSTLCWAAFHKMSERHVSALPVMDRLCRLHGVVSAKDLPRKVAHAALFRTLADPLENFPDHKLHTATCRASATLGECFALCAKHKSHHLFVVGDGDVVVGVLTLEDLLGCLVP